MLAGCWGPLSPGPGLRAGSVFPPLQSDGLGRADEEQSCGKDQALQETRAGRAGRRRLKRCTNSQSGSTGLGQEWICVFGEARTKEENPERPNEYVQRHSVCPWAAGLHPAASGGRLGLYPERGLVEALFVHYKRLVQEILGYLRKRRERKQWQGEGIVDPACPREPGALTGTAGKDAFSGVVSTLFVIVFVVC